MKTGITRHGLLGIVLVLSPILCGCSDKGGETGKYPVVTIAKGPVTSSEVTVTFKADAVTDHYMIAIGRPADRDKFENDRFEGTEIVYGNGQTVKTYGGLAQDEEYAVFARGIDKDGLAGKVAELTVHTDPKNMILATLITYTAEEAVVQFMPINDIASYNIGIGFAEDMEKFENGTLEGIETISTPTIVRRTFSCLTENRNYYVYAQGVDASGVKTEVTVLSDFTPALEVSFGLLNNISCIMNFDMSGAVGRYYLLIAGRDIYDQMVQEYALAGWPETDLIMDYGSYGEETLHGIRGMLAWQADVEFVIAISLYDTNGKHVALRYEYFTSPGIVDPALPLPSDLTMTVSDITFKSALLSCSLGANTTGYVEAMVSADRYDEIVNDPSLDEQQIRERLISGFFNNERAAVEHESSSSTWWYGSAGIDYVALAVSFNDNGIYGLGNIITRRFTAPASRGTSTGAFEIMRAGDIGCKDGASADLRRSGCIKVHGETVIRQ